MRSTLSAIVAGLLLAGVFLAGLTAAGAVHVYRQPHPTIVVGGTAVEFGSTAGPVVMFEWAR